MSDPADSTGEATGVIGDNPPITDSTPTGQEQGDQVAEKRINGLMSLAQRRTAERDAAQAEVDAMKARLAEYETQAVDEEPTPSQVELMYPERFAAEPEVDEVDPYAQPEPHVVVMETWPSRGQAAPFGESPPIPGNASSPAARYLQDQSDIAAMKNQLNALGSRWVEDAKARGLMQD